MRRHQPSNTDIRDLEIFDMGHGSVEGQTCQNICEIHKTSYQTSHISGISRDKSLRLGFTEFMLEGVSKQQAERHISSYS